MVKNIIFDIGHVLLTMKESFIDYLQRTGLTEEESILLRNTIFGEFFNSPLWAEFDRGTVLLQDIIEDAVQKQPAYKEAIEELLHNWVDIFIPIEDTVAILNNLKANGYKVYLLSNFPKENFLKVYNKYSFLREVDGAVISYEVKSIKPETLIYETLISKYSLVPQDCLFIDDRLANVEKGIALGMEGIHFIEDASLRLKLRQKGINI